MTKKTFNLPDLGEGLPDATIVEWFVKEGDTIKLDDNLVSMETAKAVVDVPSAIVPASGNLLINAAHSEAKAFAITEKRPFGFDSRLWLDG